MTRKRFKKLMMAQGTPRNEAEDFCRAFICPHCPDADIEAEECKLDKTYCVDKIYEFLQTHDFRRVKDEHGWGQTFKCFPKEQNAGTGRSELKEAQS